MARKLAIFSILCVFIAGLSEAAYLPDYEYIQGVGWLRLHIVPATWPDAQLRCHLEDATLTAPTTSTIAAAMKNTMRAHRLADSSVFTDIHASNPKGDFTTINGFSLSSITLQWADGEPNNLGNDEDCLVMTGAGELADVSCASVHPFFCLKRNTTSQHDQCNNINIANECNNTLEANYETTTQEANQCDTKAPGYTLEPRTGSCYKFHRLGLPWQRASMKCASERAHLAVINSEVESRVLKELFDQYPQSTIIAMHNEFAHIGILDWNHSRQWLTVFGETLDEAGYTNWQTAQPDNSGNNEYCGSVSRSAQYNDVPCVSLSLAFICEISPRL